MKKEKNKKGILDKLCDLLIKLAIFILIIVARLVLGFIWGIWGVLEQFYNKISAIILKLPKVAQMVLFYVFMGILIFSILNTREVKEYVLFETIKEQEKIVYVDYQDNKCNLDETSCKIYFISLQYGLSKNDSLKVVSISKYETGNYKHIGFNNFGGNFRNGKLIHFDTESEGINYMINNLKVNYFDKGISEFNDIQKYYCPVGASNDKNNINIYWLDNVKNIYNELLEEVN